MVEMKEFCQSLQKVREASGDNDQDLSRCAPLKWTVLTLLPCLIHTPPPQDDAGQAAKHPEATDLGDRAGREWEFPRCVLG